MSARQQRQPRRHAYLIMGAAPAPSHQRDKPATAMGDNCLARAFSATGMPPGSRARFRFSYISSCSRLSTARRRDKIPCQKNNSVFETFALRTHFLLTKLSFMAGCSLFLLPLNDEPRAA